MFARCRPASRLHRITLTIVTYAIIYLITSYHMKPKHTFRIVSENFSVGEQYVLIFLDASAPVFSDVDGAKVFADCGKCFVTNSRGFIPMDIYDAVLQDGKPIKTDFPPSVKRFTLEASEECLKMKLLGCKEEPKVIVDGLKYNMCQMCQKLQANRVNA